MKELQLSSEQRASVEQLRAVINERLADRARLGSRLSALVGKADELKSIAEKPIDVMDGDAVEGRRRASYQLQLVVAETEKLEGVNIPAADRMLNGSLMGMEDILREGLQPVYDEAIQDATAALAKLGHSPAAVVQSFPQTPFYQAFMGFVKNWGGTAAPETEARLALEVLGKILAGENPFQFTGK